MPQTQTATNINEYFDGAPVRVPFAFIDYQNRPVDPNQVQFKWAIAATYGGPLEAPTVYVCTDVPPATSAPGMGRVARLAEGSYEVWLDTTGQPGYWTCEPLGVGLGQALPEPPGHVFRVKARPI